MKTYWTPLHEQAVIDYQRSTDTVERERIYTKVLYKPLAYMTSIIFERYFVKRNYNLYNQKDEYLQQGMIRVYNSIDKFKGDKGTKSFSYFQKIIKNCFNDISSSSSTSKRKSMMTFADYEASQNNEREYKGKPKVYEDLYGHFNSADDDHEPNEYTVDDLIIHLKGSYGKRDVTIANTILGHIIDLLNTTRSLNQYLTTYYLVTVTDYDYRSIKNGIYKNNMSQLFYNSSEHGKDRFKKFFEEIFKNYQVNDDKRNDYNYLSLVFKQYETDKQDERINKRREFKREYEQKQIAKRKELKANNLMVRRPF